MFGMTCHVEAILAPLPCMQDPFPEAGGGPVPCEQAAAPT